MALVVKRLVFFLAVFLLSVSFVSAKDLFVDQNSVYGTCSDTYTRVQNDFTHPWCTLTRMNNQHLGGDVVYILPGEYRESIIPKSGSASQYTVYSGYGARENVKIIGSDIFSGWTNYSGNVYYASFTAQETRCEDPDHNPQTDNSDYAAYGIDCLDENNNWYFRVCKDCGLGNLNQPGELYYDHAAGRVYIWPFNSDNPNSHTIECFVRRVVQNGYGIPQNFGGSYMTFQNLTFMNSYKDGINMAATSSYINITNNEFAFISGEGTCAENPSSIIHHANGLNYRPNINVIGNVIHDQGTDEGGGFEGTMNSIHGGSGIEFYSVRDSLVANNVVYRVRSSILVKRYNGPGIIVRGNILSDFHDAIVLLGEGAGTVIENNIMYDSSPLADAEQGTMFWRGGGYGTNNLTVRHNVLSNNLIGIVMDSESTSASTGNFIQNNIFYNVGTNILTGANNPIRHTSSYNLYYDNTPLFGINYDWGDFTSRNLAQWQSATQSETNPVLVPTTGPQIFVDAANHNYNLQEGSPGVDNGKIIPGYHCSLADDNGGSGLTNCRHWSGSAPDIGAFESSYSSPGCSLPFDEPTCGCIDNSDLLETIQGWFNNQITISGLMANIKDWKECNYSMRL